MRSLAIWHIYEFYSFYKKERGYSSKKIAERFYSLLEFIVINWKIIRQEIFASLGEEKEEIFLDAVRTMLFYGEGVTKIISDSRKEFMELHGKFVNLQEAFNEIERTN